MNHYREEEWLLYKNKLLSQREMIMMEDHLYECDDCMNIFLNLIDDEELNFARKSISSSFTERVMEKLDNLLVLDGKSKTGIKNKNKKKKMIENIFIYYVAVASVILILMAGGVFTRITELPLENIREDTFTSQKDIGSIYNFTEKITDNTNGFINNFGRKK